VYRARFERIRTNFRSKKKIDDSIDDSSYGRKRNGSMLFEEMKEWDLLHSDY
jgi:hypothetical protein